MPRPWLLLFGGAALAVHAAPSPLLNSSPAVHHSVIEGVRADMPRADSTSVVELPGGDLMVFYQRFEGGGSAHDHAMSRVWTRVSHDDGRTWVEPRMLVDSLPGDINVGMPAAVLLPSGELLMVCLRTHNPSSSTMCVFRSSDHGRTFVEGPPVWRHSAGIFLQGGATSIVRLTSGRILLPFIYCPPGKDTRKIGASCFVSDDSGHTWRRTPAKLELPRRGADEPSVAELDGGLLVMSIRTQLGGPYLSRSRDGGESWSGPEPAGWTQTGGIPLHGTESCTCLRRIPGTNALMLLWNNAEYHMNADHSGARTPLTAAVSVDAGDSWTIVSEVAAGQNYEFTNPNCTFTSKGEAVVTCMSGYHARPWPARGFDVKFDLLAEVIEPAWWQAALASALAAAAAPPPAYHVPGSDKP